MRSLSSSIHQSLFARQLDARCQKRVASSFLASYATSPDWTYDFTVQGRSAFPLALAYSSLALNRPILLAADEDGVVTLFDTRRTNNISHNTQQYHYHRNHPLEHTYFGSQQFHHRSLHLEPLASLYTQLNGIFDVAWFKDDHFFAAAGGDGIVKLFDVEHMSKTIQRANELRASSTLNATHSLNSRRGYCDVSNTHINLRGQEVLCLHSGDSTSIKCVRQHPENPFIVATASRNGKLSFYDTRVPDKSKADVTFITNVHYSKPVDIVTDAHKPKYSQNSRNRASTLKRKRGVPNHINIKDSSADASVTSLAFIPQNHFNLFSSGATDASVKLWDLRNTRKGPILAVIPSTTQSHSLSMPSTNIPSRPCGITSIDVDPTGKYLIASALDSNIYMYHTHAIDADCVNVFSGHKCNSFYMKSKFSPDSKHILAGSANSRAYIWNVDAKQPSPRVYLEAHLVGEVTGLAWSNHDKRQIATCGDDGTIRVWNAHDEDDDPHQLHHHHWASSTQSMRFANNSARHATSSNRAHLVEYYQHPPPSSNKYHPRPNHLTKHSTSRQAKPPPKTTKNTQITDFFKKI